MEYLIYAVGGLIGVYLVFRLIFAAYFMAKQSHEEHQHHGKKPQPGR